MTQVRRDEAFMIAFGGRLRALMEEHLRSSWDSMANLLGYANSTTLRQASQGKALLSTEKLASLANVTDRLGRRVSVDWLLTGIGSPLIESESNGSINALAQRVLTSSSQDQSRIAGYLDVVQRSRQPARVSKRSA